MSSFSWPVSLSTSAPIQIIKDGAPVTITKDTVTPAGTIPMPVELVAASGSPINITAGDLNVQMSAFGVNYDSARIGDGTNLLGITASSEAKVSDATAQASLASIDSKLTSPITVTGPLTDTQLRASAVPVSVSSLPLPSGAATEATLSAINTKFTNPLPVSGPLTDTQLRASAVPVSLASTTITGSVAVTGPLTDTQLRASAVPVSLTSTTVTNTVAVSGPLTDTQLRASSVPVSLTSTTITGTVAVSAASLPLPAGAATESTLAGLHYAQGSTTSGQTGALIQGAVTTSAPTYTTGQTAPISLTTNGLIRGTVAINSFANTAIGQKTMSGSMPVVISSDQSNLPIKGRPSVWLYRNDNSSANILTSAYTEIVTAAAIGVDVHEVEVFDSSGQSLVLATGSAGSETMKLYVFAGGNGRMPWFIPVGTRVAVKAISGNATSGEFLMNFYGA
jgi:hypothetical protein